MGVIYAGGRPEDALAHYAEYQGQTNSCGEYSVAAGLSVLEGQPGWLPAREVVEAADSWTVADTFLTMGLLGLIAGRSLRMSKGGPTTSWQVANLAQRLAKKRGIKVETSVKVGHPGMRDEIVSWLKRGDAITIFTVGWDDKTKAALEDPNHARLVLSSQPKYQLADLTLDYTAHIMVLAGRDDDQNRWGFINSWCNGAVVNRLCWMTDEDFEETWGYSRSPFFIPRMWVTIALR